VPAHFANSLRISTLKTLLAPLTLAFLIVSSLLTSTHVIALVQTSSEVTPLKPERIQSQTTRQIVDRLEKQHYSKLVLSDEISNKLLSSYLDTLDRERLFFLASDIKEFETYRNVLDDQLRASDLTAAFNIFNRYRERYVERLKKISAELPTLIPQMDFSKDEEVLIDRSKQPWASSKAELDELWNQRLKSSVLALRLSGKKPEDIIKTLTKRYKSQLNQFEQLQSEDAFQTYMNALTELYDPHTSYFSPRTSKNFNINMSLKLEGIGAVLQADDEFTKVVRLVPAGPADKQGQLKPADRIVGVGQGANGEIEDVVGWRLDDVVDKIRGDKGSIVRLEVIPASAKTEEEHKIITIERNEVKLEEQSAKKKIVEITQGDRKVKIGVIDLPIFYIDFEAMRRGDPEFRSTTRDVYKLLTELVNEGVEGIVMDLRNNGGGSLQEANALTGLFIEAGPVVQIRTSNSRVLREGKERSTAYYDGPLVVLINRMSASASEIFAGAIQDYNRGIVIGEQSFGKGTVQSLVELEHGQLKLTESKFYRISGDSTQHRGVIPDITFPSLFDMTKIGESALDNALPWDRIEPIRHRNYFEFSPILPDVNKKHLERAAKDPDFIYLNEQLQTLNEARNIKTISLNEAKRKAERDKERTTRLNLENKRRAAKGLKPITLADQDKEDEATENDPVGAAEEKEKKEEIDPLLRESANILVDALTAYRQPAFSFGNF
jgi:carboxyl-terminal processing protease